MAAQHHTNANEELESKLVFLERLLEEMAEQFDEIYVVANTARHSHESLDEEHQDPSMIALFRVIARMAADQKLMGYVRDQVNGIAAIVKAGSIERAPPKPASTLQDAPKASPEPAA